MTDSTNTISSAKKMNRKVKVNVDLNINNNDDICDTLVPIKTKVIKKIKKTNDINNEQTIKSTNVFELITNHITNKSNNIEKQVSNIEINDDNDICDNNKDNTSEKREYKLTLKSIEELNKIMFSLKSKQSKNTKIKEAWKTLDEYNIPNKENLKIISSHPGHFVSQGCSFGQLKNAHWLVIDKNDKEKKEYYIMYCDTNSYTYFSKEDYNDVINPEPDSYPTWHIEKIGYIMTKTYKGTRCATYLHQLVCKKYNVKERDNLSVDHINQNKIDNRHTNLRFATQSLQNQNREKRKRQHNARPLPEGITHADIPKYVVYYEGTYGPHKKMRNWFCIEQHPKQQSIRADYPKLEKKRWEGTKSMAIDIKEKLKQAKDKLEEYDKM